MRARTLLAVAATAGTLFLAGCSSSSTTAEDATGSAATAAESMASEATSAAASAMESAAAGNIVETASGAPELSTLVTAITAAGLGETLSGPGPFTVFAPTNDAFDALPEGVLDKLVKPENKDALTQVLTYHVVSGNVPSSDVTAGKVATVEGSDIELATEGGVTVNGANVIKADILTSNGVVHEIDAVLLPESFDPATLK